ncbi:MAG: cupin domain-containing protein [Terriglobales bacterium]
MKSPTAAQLIEHFGLQPLTIEGGLFRQTYVAEESVVAEALPKRYGAPRTFGTAIYYLLTSEPDSFSALHRLETDEIYHFYLGGPVEMLLLHPDRHGERIVLGPDVLGGQHVQFVVPRGVWQGLRLIYGGSFALMGTTMAPGFDLADWAEGKRDPLIREYPEHAELIRALTWH